MGQHFFNNSPTSLYFTEKNYLPYDFKSFHEHSSPIFRKLNIIKLDDLISYHIAVFMYRFNNSLLPSAFDAFFSKVSEIHASLQHTICS